MAKKKAIPKKEDDLEGLDDDILDDIEPEYPSLKKSKEKTSEDVEMDIEGEEILEEELEYEMEEIPKPPEYKYLNLSILKGKQENDYHLIVEGQSHGFLNILVKHLLSTDGVNSAAYKVTRIDPPEVFVRLEKGNKIKNILHKAIQSLKDEVEEVKKTFKPLMK
ncbi:MAG: RpoL/Rpb11 RNA polymerase subunit family protein [Candidatus Hodarchaeota archaeon]